MGTGVSVETARFENSMLWNRLHCSGGWSIESLVVKTIPIGLFVGSLVEVGGH